jgi:hypothetical protein
MSVIVIGRFKADPAALDQAFVTHRQTFLDVHVDAESQGAIHHQFGAADGEVVIVDEWPDEATFHAFFAGQQDVPKIMAEIGVSAPPTFEIYRQMDSPDRF